MTAGLTIIIPAYNEEDGIPAVVSQLHAVMRGLTYEIIVVDDGSTDGTLDILKRTEDIRWIAHPTNQGYGTAIKTGIRLARYDLIAITDADATYALEKLPEMLAYMDRYDMVIGCRSGEHYWGQFVRRVFRKTYLWLAEWLTGTSIPDVNSGFRIFRKQLAQRFDFFLSNRFSFTTGLTLAAVTNGCHVAYLPVAYHKRIGSSKVFSLLHKVGIAQVLLQTALLFAPTKLILPLVVLFGGSAVLLVIGAALWPSPYLFLAALLATSLTVAVLLAGLVLSALSKIAKK